MENSRADRLKYAKHFERAQGWLLLDRFDLASEALQEIPPTWQKRPEVVLFRAHLHMAAKQWALAEPVLRQLLEEDATEPQSWINLAFVVRRARSIAEAETILREARRQFPAVALIWFNLACYAAQQDRLREVQELLDEATWREPALAELAKEDPDLAPYWHALASGQLNPRP